MEETARQEVFCTAYALMPTTSSFHSLLTNIQDVAPGGKCNEYTGRGTSSVCQGSLCSGNFHIYEVVIDRTTSPESVKYWLDRKLVYTVTANDLGTAVWNQTFHQGFYLILNVAMGGSYPNALAGSQTPTASTVGGYPMAVDYVGVWTTK